MSIEELKEEKELLSHLIEAQSGSVDTILAEARLEDVNRQIAALEYLGE